MPDDQDSLFRKFIRTGWKFCFAFLLGGIAVFLYTCTKQ